MNTEEIWNLESVIEETKKFFQETLPGEKATETDFSYITPELLDEYKNNAKSKSPECIEQAKLDDVPCFYGHSVVVNRNQLSYRNNNSSNGCDTIYHLCSPGNYSWTVTVSAYQLRNCTDYSGSFLAWR